MVSQIDTLLGGAFAELQSQVGSGRDVAEALEAADRLRDLSFPGLLAMLSSLDDRAEVGASLIQTVATSLADHPVAVKNEWDANDVDRNLTQLLVAGTLPNLPTRDNRALVAAVVKQVLRQSNVPVSTTDALRAAELLTTGEFFGDLTTSVAAVTYTITGLPLAILKDVGSSPRRVASLVRSLVRDTGETVIAPFRILNDLRDGHLDSPPNILRHTTKALFGFATLRSSLETVRTIAMTDSVRFAITVAARIRGLPIDDTGVTRVVSSALNPDQPNLGPALLEAYNLLRERLGRDGLFNSLDRFATAEPPG